MRAGLKYNPLQTSSELCTWKRTSLKTKLHTHTFNQLSTQQTDAILYEQRANTGIGVKKANTVLIQELG